MSWSLTSVTVPAGGNVRAVLEAAAAEQKTAASAAAYGAEDAAADAIAKAIDAAVALAPAVQVPGAGLTVSLSGHANPGHAKTAGWSNDTITVNMYQQDPAPAEAP